MSAASTLATVTTAPADPAHRGTTTLADRVVEKIAARAATEVTHCVGLPRTIAGIPTGRTAVQAQARRDGSVTGLSLEVGLVYPAPVVSTTRQIRGHVTDVVSRLCGLAVDHVDIRVGALVQPERKEPRVR